MSMISELLPSDEQRRAPELSEAKIVVLAALADISNLSAQSTLIETAINNR